MATEGVRKIRRKAIGANVAAVCVVAASITLMINYLSYRHYQRFDWTKSSYYSLSEKTVKVLNDLTVPIKVYVFYPPFNRTFDDIRELLNRYTDVNKKLEVEYVDPEKDPSRVRFLMNKFKIPAPSQAALWSSTAAAPMEWASANQGFGQSGARSWRMKASRSRR